jgi:uncharacterized membrane protein YqaE (UPF0057 family)
MTDSNPNITVQLQIPEPVSEQDTNSTRSFILPDAPGEKPAQTCPTSIRQVFEDEAGTRLWLDAFLGVCIPPLQMLRKHDGFNTEVLITLCLWLVFFLPGIFYYFLKDGVKPLPNVILILVPPAGYWMVERKCGFHFWATFGLWILTFWVGGWVWGFKHIGYSKAKGDIASDQNM